MMEGFKLERNKIKNEIDSNLELTKDGFPIILNENGERVESVQFKELVKTTGNQKEATKIYRMLKKLENGDFRNSQLRDKNGELMIVWHGSSRKFEEFNMKAKGQWRWKNEGMHFQSSKEVIAQYAEKAKRAWNIILYDIAIEHFGIEQGRELTGEQDKKAREIFNEIVEDLIKNGENSKYWHKNYLRHYDKQKGEEILKRDPGGDAIAYGKQLFGTEWALEIFGGEMPSKKNCSINEKYGTYFGNDIGEYKYAAVLNIKNPFRKETNETDDGFEIGEKSHREERTDGTILSHKKGIFDFPMQTTIAGTVNSISAAVFDTDKIKTIGVETENGFEIRKNFFNWIKE